MNRKDLMQFLIWMRNGTAYCTAWFLLLIVLVGFACGAETISLTALAKMLLLVSGGVFIFCVCFTSLFIKRWQFTARLTGFILSLGAYESLGFYWTGFFSGKGSELQWYIFTAIIIILYLLCIGIYQLYSRKQGTLYTEALRRYQEKRSEENVV